jgi:hypothetical protein
LPLDNVEDLDCLLRGQVFLLLHFVASDCLMISWIDFVGLEDNNCENRLEELSFLQPLHGLLVFHTWDMVLLYQLNEADGYLLVYVFLLPIKCAMVSSADCF